MSKRTLTTKSSTQNSSSSRHNVPEQFLCDMTSKILIDPVTTIHGYNIERKALAKWFAQGYDTCPISGEPLKKNSDHIFSNKKSRKDIQNYLFEQNDLTEGEKQQQEYFPQHELTPTQQQQQQQQQQPQKVSFVSLVEDYYYEDEGENMSDYFSFDHHLRDHPFFAQMYNNNNSNLKPNGIPKTIWITPDSDDDDKQRGSIGTSSLKVTKKIGKVLKKILSIGSSTRKLSKHEIIAIAA